MSFMVATTGDFIEHIKSLGFVQTKRKHGGSHIWSFKHEDGRHVKLAGERTRLLSIGLFKSLCQHFPAAKEAIWS